MGNQSFWLGAMSALAVVFLFLFVGVVMGTVSLGSSNNSDTTGVQARIVDDTAPAAPTAPTKPVEVTVTGISKADWVRGDKNAKVTVVEFSDIDCPFCQKFHDTMNDMVDEYAGKVNWVYRDFPLDALHPQARDKAIAAECVGQLNGNDAYWTYLDGLFTSSDPDEINAEAKKLGVDMVKFAACQEDPATADLIAADEKAGAAAGAQGTPYSVIIVGDKNIPVNGAVPAAQLKAQIDAALEG